MIVKSPHRCEPPSPFYVATGTVWECEQCGRRWKLELNYSIHEDGVGWRRTVPTSLGIYRRHFT